MTPPGGDSQGAGMPPGQDLGLPIRELADLELEPSPRFMARVRGKIYRRMATAQFATYSWHLPKVILVEMASLLDHFLRVFGTNKERKP